jgi:ABC-type phosphate/phosphonate transport system permease subunit
MIDMSLGGLLGAIAGTIVAAFAYLPLALLAQRVIAARRSPEEPRTSAQDFALLRRGVLAFDILIFAGLGYWIGQQFDL